MIVFCVIITLVCSFRACHLPLTRNHMFICEIWGKLTSAIFLNFEISLVSLRRFQNFKKVNSVNLSQISLLKIWLLVLITQLIVINTVLLTKLFCNYPLFLPTHWFVTPAVKRIYLQHKVLVGLVWLTSNHLFGSDKSPSRSLG